MPGTFGLRIGPRIEKPPRNAADAATFSARRPANYPYFPGYDGQFIQNLIAVLGEQGEHAAKAVPLILKAAARSDVGTTSTIVTALGKIGPAAKDALPLLSNALQSPDPGLRRAAADAIAAIAKK